MQAHTDALHRAIWRGEDIAPLLLQPGVDVNALDARGNTALHIAAHFGDRRAVDALLAHGAASVLSRPGLRPFDEAVAGGWRDVAAVLLKDDVKRKVDAFRAAWPQAKAELEKQADCHWAMQWVFDVFHIHLSVLAPSDTYHVYKRGSCLRADYTLLGFKLQANHARLSILLREGRVYAINHDAKTIQDLTALPSEKQLDASVQEALQYFLAHDVCAHSPYGWADARTAPRFKREKEWFTGRKATTTLLESEEETGFDCAVYKTLGVQFESLIRSDPHAKRTRIPRKEPSAQTLQRERSLYDAYFAPASRREEEEAEADEEEEGGDEEEEEHSRHHGGRARRWKDGLVWESEKITRMTRSFSGKVWMCDSYPMQASQLVPMLAALGLASQAFQLLHTFITQLSLPPGFPLKIEIPVFFPISAVAEMQSYEALPSECDDQFFELPKGYEEINEPWFGHETREMMKSVKTTK